MLTLLRWLFIICIDVPIGFGWGFLGVFWGAFYLPAFALISLYNRRESAVLHFIIGLAFVIMCVSAGSWSAMTIVLLVLTLVSMVDCVRDFKLDGTYGYYENKKEGVDKLFIRKTLFGLFLILVASVIASFFVDKDNWGLHTGFSAAGVYAVMSNWLVSLNSYDGSWWRFTLGALSVSVKVSRWWFGLIKEVNFLNTFFSLLPLIIIPRAAFMLFIYPHISRRTLLKIKQAISYGVTLPDGAYYSPLADERYYFKKFINNLCKKGIVVSNMKTIEKEASLSKRKFYALFTQKEKKEAKDLKEKLIANAVKVAEKLTGVEKAKAQARAEKLKKFNETLEYSSSDIHHAYLSALVFEQYSKRISEVMSKKTVVAPKGIKLLNELKDLNLTVPPNETKSTKWSEFFIIQALQPLVADGTFEDLDISDDEFDNHAYRYSKSEVKIASINANNDPRFALDDD